MKEQQRTVVRSEPDHPPKRTRSGQRIAVALATLLLMFVVQTGTADAYFVRYRSGAPQNFTWYTDRNRQNNKGMKVQAESEFDFCEQEAKYGNGAHIADVGGGCDVPITVGISSHYGHNRCKRASALPQSGDGWLKCWTKL